MQTMPALVKAKPEPGCGSRKYRCPSRTSTTPHQDPQDGHLRTDVHIYNWDEWAQRTSLCHARRTRIRGRWLRSEAMCTTSSRRSRLRRGAPGLRPVSQLPGGPPAPVPHTSGVGVNRPGAFAEYLCIPVTNVWYCDPTIPTDVLACFDPLGNATHTALSADVLGEDVLITGAGPIGCMATAIVRHAGARHVVVTDVNPSGWRSPKKWAQPSLSTCAGLHWTLRRSSA